MINRKTILTLSVALAAVILLFTACPNDTIPESYTIIYNANGGSGSMNSMTLDEGATITLPTHSFTKNNSSFAGWSTTSNGSAAYSDGASFTMGSSDVILYAQWNTVDYTALFTDSSAGLTGVYERSTSFADVDGDGDQDLLITGYTGSNRISTLYTNDGIGKFTDANAGLTGVNCGSSSFADVDNDGDQDLLITGITSQQNDKIATLYTNDGAGKFSDANAGLTGVQNGSTSFTDVDGDGDQDLLITGSFTTILYTNDGLGNFTDANAGLTGVGSGSSSFADVDNDGDQDLLITGFNNNDVCISVLYINWANSFIEAPTDLLSGTRGSVSFADVDGDGDQDLLICGENNYSNVTIFKSTLYTNDGAGRFSDTGLSGISIGSGCFIDVDNDGDQDLLITGNPAQLYINDGTGKFTEANAGLKGISYGTSSFADVDNDGDQDLLISGNIISTLYLNELY